MPKRQEKPYAARIAALTKPKLIIEIGKLISSGVAGEDIDERLRICVAEDEKRGGTCYDKAIAQFNTALGWKETAPGCFDIRDVQ